MEQEDGENCISVSSYARLHVKEVPDGIASKLCLLAKEMPITACGLLQHESKMYVLYFSIKMHDSYVKPIKAKEELVFHVSFRQFVARPIYSMDSMNSNKHKLERFLHAGHFIIASIYAPISFPPLTLIALKHVEGDGAPAVTQDNFKEDYSNWLPPTSIEVESFCKIYVSQPRGCKMVQAREVFTNCTHGFMKCIFNGVLQLHDNVCMSLYKRAYPKSLDHLFPISCFSYKTSGLCSLTLKHFFF